MSAEHFNGLLNYVNFVIIIGIILSLSYLISFRINPKYIHRGQHVYVITTVEDSNQTDHLIEIGNVLKTLNNVTWLVVESSDELSVKVSETLIRMRIKFEHLLGQKDPKKRALLWLKEHNYKGLILFTDRNNTLLSNNKLKTALLAPQTTA
ncbi:GlcAT-P family protein [Megaselia abdita]